MVAITTKARNMSRLRGDYPNAGPNFIFIFAGELRKGLSDSLVGTLFNTPKGCDATADPGGIWLENTCFLSISFIIKFEYRGVKHDCALSCY